MILIDALYINNSGGKILFDYLVNELEKINSNTFYLFDKRCGDSYLNIPNARKIYLTASLKNRYSFYQKNKNQFDSVLCFGNIPPMHKLNMPVFTYFHQPLFLDTSIINMSFSQKLLIYLKTLFLRTYKNHTNYWFVQNNTIADGLSKKYKIKPNKIKILPFYPPIDSDGFQYERIKNSFIYVSNSSPHKNHKKLINAFCKFYDENQTGKLIITVPTESEAAHLAEKKRSLGYPVINIGLVNRNDLYKYYQKSEYLIFPSLAESFGLGLVEAIENGCKVIGADLPYMYQVCEPSIIFDPLKENSIIDALKKSLHHKKESKIKINNEIEKLIEFINIR